MSQGDHDSSKSVAGRTLAILATFDINHTELTLSDISRRSGIPLATSHRLTAELTKWGALERGPSGAYQIGIRLWETGLLTPVSTRIRSAASPYLQELQSISGENIQLAMRDEYGGLYLEKFSGHDAVPIFSQVGSRIPLHATAVGKMLLATADDDFVNQFLATELKRYTRLTITDPDMLRQQIREARANGYASTVHETMQNAASVAVPVPTPHGWPCVVLGVVFRSDTQHREPSRLVRLLRLQAQRISDRLAAPEADLPGKRQAPPPMEVWPAD